MRQVAHVLLTRPPLASLPKEIYSLDLHVLGTPPAFVLSQDQTLTKKFNHLLKLLWVFVLRLSKELLVYFNYILFNFQRPYLFAASSDFLILSLTQPYVNNFFQSFFSHNFVSNEIYLITHMNNCQHFVFVFLFVRHQRRDLSYHLIYYLFKLFSLI